MVRKRKRKMRPRAEVVEELGAESCTDSSSSSSTTDEILVVEIAPGQVARLHDPKTPCGPRRAKSSRNIAALVADHWLCPGCDAFIKISIEVCIQCGHRRVRPGCPPSKTPASAATPAQPPAPLPKPGPGPSSTVEVEVDVNANAVDYERLKKLFLETGTSIAKEVIAAEDKKKCCPPAPPAQPVPYYPIIIPQPAPAPAPVPLPNCQSSSSSSSSSSTSTSSTPSSSVSRRSFERVRANVRYLGDRVSRLAHRSDALDAGMAGLNGTMRGMGAEVQGLGGAMRALDNFARDNRERTNILETRTRVGLGRMERQVDCVERQVEVMGARPSRSWSRGRSRVRCEERLQREMQRDRERVERAREMLERDRERTEREREWLESRREWAEGRREMLENRREGLETRFEWMGAETARLPERFGVPAPPRRWRWYG